MNKLSEYLNKIKQSHHIEDNYRPEHEPVGLTREHEVWFWREEARKWRNLAMGLLQEKRENR